MSSSVVVVFSGVLVVVLVDIVQEVQKMSRENLEQ